MGLGSVRGFRQRGFKVPNPDSAVPDRQHDGTNAAAGRLGATTAERAKLVNSSGHSIPLFLRLSIARKLLGPNIVLIHASIP